MTVVSRMAEGIIIAVGTARDAKNTGGIPAAAPLRKKDEQK